MPVLRYLGSTRHLSDHLLDVSKSKKGLEPPLLFDSSQSWQIRIEGSGMTSDYAYVLSGKGTQVNDRHLEAIRVLRHGDRVRLGDGLELIYLDFVSLKVTGPLIGQPCFLSSCEYTQKLTEEDEAIQCPWCGLFYHTPCWLELERCATRNCYPVRRMLLAELGGRVKIEQMTEKSHVMSRLCTAQCSRNAPINAGEETIRCLNSKCSAPYHPNCWLSMRGPCPECGDDIPGLIDRLIFRADQTGHGGIDDEKKPTF